MSYHQLSHLSTNGGQKRDAIRRLMRQHSPASACRYHRPKRYFYGRSGIDSLSVQLERFLRDAGHKPVWPDPVRGGRGVIDRQKIMS